MYADVSTHGVETYGSHYYTFWAVRHIHAGICCYADAKSVISAY